MPINYSLVKSGASVRNGIEARVYARAQSLRTLDKEEVAKYAAAHYAQFLDYTQVEAAIDALQKSIVDLLCDGNQVSLGELGTFYAHIDSKTIAATEVQEHGFQPLRDIDDVTVKWKPGRLLKSLMKFNHITFKRKPTVEARMAKMKEAMQLNSNNE